MIAFLDLGRLHAAIADELADAHRRVVATNRLILGPELAAFEAAFASYCGAAHCVGVSNGLEAMTLTLSAAGVGPGDEIIVPAHTYIATWLAVSRTGATPVPVEVQDDTWLIDPAAIAAAVTPRTKAVLPVHLYGQCADMRAVMAVAERHALFVLEDAAQAHGARDEGNRAGALGHASAFSFYPSKNLGALGDAGAVVTHDGALAARIRKLRNYGSAERNVHEMLGHNARLDEMQAAFLNVKLGHLDAWNAARRQRANLYFDTLDGVSDLALPANRQGAEPVWHLFCIRSDRRDALMTALRAENIGCFVHYPTPPHLQPAYAHLKLRRGVFPITENIADTIFSLPMDPLMLTADVERVTAVITASLS